MFSAAIKTMTLKVRREDRKGEREQEKKGRRQKWREIDSHKGGNQRSADLTSCYAPVLIFLLL